jgi:flagellar basal-body rod modification protein FlgD
MTNAIALAANAASNTAGGSQRTGLTDLAERDTFLKLLVAQVRYQDPLTPQEPIEFVSQLAQFSQLETLLSMRASIEAIEQGLGSDSIQDENLMEPRMNTGEHR